MRPRIRDTIVSTGGRIRSYPGAMSRSPVGAALLLAAVAVSWGAIPLIVRGDVPWQQLVAARIWLGAATLVAILAAQGRLRLPASSRGRILVSGVLLAVHWSSFFLSLRETTVAIALAVLYLGPVLASVMAPAFWASDRSAGCMWGWRLRSSACSP